MSTTALVYTSDRHADAARARRGWDALDRAVLAAIAKGPSHTIDQLAARLQPGIKVHFIVSARDVLVEAGLVEQVMKALKETSELVVVHRITAAGLAVLEDRGTYQQAA
jgi:hypothetical protein